MKYILSLSLFIVLFCAFASAAPIWKVFCAGQPLLRARLDPIVAPGKIAGHSHKIFGGANFSAGAVGQTPLNYYNDVMDSSCTTCSISQVDLSQYWHPDLYYQWPNGSFSLVPDSGLTVYYLSRGGDSGDQKTNPNWQPIPKGLRMLAGSPMRRTFNPASVADTAVSYVCLGSSAPEGPAFPTDKYNCKDGLRAQVFFPMCWNGVDLDSADHMSHMAYPSKYNTGDCPATHPVRVPGVFFEALYSVSAFPHGTGSNPFVWSCGDPTGYGFHGDFLSGWDEDVMKAAIHDPTCDISNPDLSIGNNVKACVPLSRYVVSTPAGGCQSANPVPLTEDLGMSHTLPRLPGCNPVTLTSTKVPCDYPSTIQPSPASGERYQLKSVKTGKYLSGNQPFAAMAANVTYPTLQEVWGYNPAPSSTAFSLKNEASGKFATAGGPNDRIEANRGSVQSWETFTLVPQGSYVVILAGKNNKYVTVAADATLAATATAITPDCYFVKEVPTGGGITPASVPEQPVTPVQPVSPSPTPDAPVTPVTPVTPVAPVAPVAPAGDLPYTVYEQQTIFGNTMSSAITKTGEECWNLCASTVGCCAGAWASYWSNTCYLKNADTVRTNAIVAGSGVTTYKKNSCASYSPSNAMAASDAQYVEPSSGLSSMAFLGIGIAAGVVVTALVVVVIVLVISKTKKPEEERA